MSLNPSDIPAHECLYHYKVTPAVPDMARWREEWFANRLAALDAATEMVENHFPDLEGRIKITPINRHVIRAYEETWAPITDTHPHYETARTWAGEFTFFDRDEGGPWLAINRCNFMGVGIGKIVKYGDNFEVAVWVDGKLCAISTGGMPNDYTHKIVSVLHRMAAPGKHPLKGRVGEVIQLIARAHAEECGAERVVYFGSFTEGARKAYARMGLEPQERLMPTRDDRDKVQEVYVDDISQPLGWAERPVLPMAAPVVAGLHI
jgi:hypothetical protein